jgi:glycosyltransferase involved in cell wall biosynthesis
MHVAYIHQHFATRNSATGTRSYEMSRRLIEAGHRVSMICGVNEATRDTLRQETGAGRLTIDGIEVHCVAERYSNRMGFARRLWAFYRFMREARRIVCTLDADLVLATSTPLTVGIPGMKGARRLGVPFVFELRDLWPEGPIAVGVLRNRALIWYAYRLEHKLYRAADHLIALAPGIQEGIERVGIPGDRITLIPNGCDLDLFTPSDEPLDDARFGAPEEFRLCFTGAHGLMNGLDAVLDAAAELLRRGEPGIRFVLIGDGNQKERLLGRSRAQGLDSIITWLPLVPKVQLARVLPRMDAGMMILQNLRMIQYGTSPNKFFDYIACGLPVLNNYPGWLAELINEHRCGIVVPPDDAVAFADACIRLRDHRDEAEAMGRRGRRLAESKFDRNQLTLRMVQVLEQVHARHNAAGRAPN